MIFNAQGCNAAFAVCKTIAQTHHQIDLTYSTNLMSRVLKTMPHHLTTTTISSSRPHHLGINESTIRFRRSHARSTIVKSWCNSQTRQLLQHRAESSWGACRKLASLRRPPLAITSCSNRVQLAMRRVVGETPHLQRFVTRVYQFKPSLPLHLVLESGSYGFLVLWSLDFLILKAIRFFLLVFFDANCCSNWKSKICSTISCSKAWNPPEILQFLIFGTIKDFDFQQKGIF